MAEQAGRHAVADDAPRWDAFLSYSSRDAVWVARMQRFLENYRLPGGRRLRVYRDETDITGGELPDQLRTALAASASLLVCCSESAACSAWVAREIEAFRAAAPDRPILPVILDGEPPANLPAALRHSELRWADLRAGWRFGRPRRRTRIELIRAVAAAAGEDFRTLLPLDQRRRRRNRLISAGISSAVLAAIALRPVPDWGDVTPAGQPLFGCDTLDDGIAFYQLNPPQASKNIVNVTRNALADDPRRQVLDETLLPRGRLLPAFVDSAIRTQCRGPAQAWLGAPASGRCIRLTRSSDDKDFHDYGGGGSARMTDVEVGDALFVLDEFWSAIDHRVWDDYGRTMHPSDGLPVALQGNEWWLGFPANPYSRGSLWHSGDNGVTWTRQDGLHDVRSVRTLEIGVVIAARKDGELGFFVHHSDRFEPLETPGKGDQLEVCGDVDGQPVIRADRRAYRRLYRAWWKTWID